MATKNAHGAVLNKEIRKDELVKIIKAARKSISILGATVVDLPWADLVRDGLGEKFFEKSNDFTIRILCESESLISQYALLSELNSGARGTYTRGNLNGVKQNVLSELKAELIDYAKKHNIQATGLEPPVDTMKKELNAAFDIRIRSEILDAIISQKREAHLKDIIISKAKIYFDKEVTQFVKFATDKYDIMKLIEKVNLFKNEVEELKKKVEHSISIIDLSDDRFRKLDMTYICQDCMTDNCDMLLDSGEFVYNVDEIKFIFGNGFPKVIHEIIADYVIDDEDIRSLANRKINSARKSAERMASEEVEILKEEYNERWSTKQRLFIKNCYLPIPVSMIEVDEKLFITQALTEFDHIDKFQYVGRLTQLDKSAEDKYQSYWIDEFRKYYHRYFIDSMGAQKYSTEETAKGDRLEVVDMFDGQRVRIGTGPRDAFLSNPSITKTVVWALIFDREGRMLIHQRALNAKDNRGLWDKSVGGHVSIQDLDTIEAVRREIAEELYHDEKEGQGGHDDAKDSYDSIEKVIYLGEWKTKRYPKLTELHLEPKESYLFSLNYVKDVTIKNFRKEAVKTTRVLPGGETVDAMCFVDPYLCIVPAKFDMDSLHNSKYALLHPNELRRCVNEQKIRLNGDKIYDENAPEMEFHVTSDLRFLVSNPVWTDVVTEFARKVAESFSENSTK
ncbi:MAG: NUDIX domain-containing protein [Clostridiales bacterium]|nr:NUDIX domain-containing protein [Clostridiales bacterium]